MKHWEFPLKILGAYSFNNISNVLKLFVLNHNNNWHLINVATYTLTNFGRIIMNQLIFERNNTFLWNRFLWFCRNLFFCFNWAFSLSSSRLRPRDLWNFDVSKMKDYMSEYKALWRLLRLTCMSCLDARWQNWMGSLRLWASKQWISTMPRSTRVKIKCGKLHGHCFRICSVF